jgi:mRNA-degrading endonuclease toxin of MazEF toxin-antitoxin module
MSRRGDIFLADLRGRAPRKNEAAKTRPVLIVQSSRLDPELLSTVVVLPLTSQPQHDLHFLRMPVDTRGDLHHDSQIVVEQVQSISRNRLVGGPIARLDGQELKRLNRILAAVLDLSPPD